MVARNTQAYVSSKAFFTTLWLTAYELLQGGADLPG
jgi:hypothetical protein